MKPACKKTNSYRNTSTGRCRKRCRPIKNRSRQSRRCIKRCTKGMRHVKWSGHCTRRN